MNIQDFIDAVSQKDFAKAEPMFNDIMTARVGDALDAEKINVANQFYNDIEPEEIESEEAELEDEASDDIEGAPV